jgi:hypothetical protein
MENGYYEIGSHREIEGGTIYEAGGTDNGFCYKSEKAIREHSGVCYITEGAFTEDTFCDRGDMLLHDKEGNLILNNSNIATLVEWGFVSTWDSARETVKSHIESYEFACFDDKVILNSKEMWDMYQEFIDRLTEDVLECVVWQGVDTLINEWDLDEELDCFLQEKFAEFAKKRFEEDGDDTEYEDTDDLWDMLSNYFGCYCYRNDDYSLTDWDSLIDRWEDEPAY